MKKLLALMLAFAMLALPVNVLAEDEENFFNDGVFLENGTKDYEISKEYEYTVFVLEPEEIGEYYIASTNAVMGIISYNGMWATVTPSAETVNENKLEWKCTSVGQSIWVAVKAEGDTASITVSNEEIVIVEIPKEEYVNKAELSQFTFEGDADKLAYIDFEDDIIDTAVLGEDGFYHRNKADGAILYVNLNDPLMNLADAMSYGQLKYVVYEDGKAVKIIDYNNAFNQYLNNIDEATSLYPLTADLIEIYKNVGEYQGWYAENGWIGTAEDAWMFACYYDENYVAPSDIKLGDVNGNGEIDSRDYVLIRRYILKTYTLNDAQFSAADVNCDGEVSSRDYVFIRRHILNTYKIGE